jgi:hypothetical protein
MVTFNDTDTLQGLYQHTKFLSGQSNLSIEDFTRLANFAMDDYSSIVLSCDGKWKFDDSTNLTNPQGYTQVTSGQKKYTVDTNYLKIRGVDLKVDGKWTVLEQIDRDEYKNQSLEEVFSENGTPKYYDYDGQQIILYPAPNFSDSGTVDADDPGATASLHVDFSRPAEYFDTTDTTATIGIPRVHHQYIALKATEMVMMSTNDPSISGIQNKLIAWEGREQNGQLSGGKIREHFTTRDEDRPRRIKPKLHAAFTNSFNQQ